MSKPQATNNVLTRRVPFLLFSIMLALSFATTGCDMYTSGNTPQQSVQDTLCNAPLFEQVRFSSSQQDGTALYTSYATDTTFNQMVVVALNPLTHQRFWQHSFPVNANAAMRLTAADGIVYALFQRANTDWSWIFALNAQTGEQLWTYNEAGADDIAVCNGTVLLLGSRSLHVFESKTGKLLWTYGQPAGDERLGSTLSTTKDTIYVMSFSLISEQTTVHALNLQDGKERWQVQLPNNQIFGTEGSLTLTEQALYVLQSPLEEPGQLVALRPADGGQIWSAMSETDQKILMASNQTLYLANPWQLDAFQSSNGKHLWSQRFGGIANSIVGSSQHGIFETQDSASFCSLDLTNGTARWCLHLSLLGWDGTPFFIDQTTIYLYSDVNHNHPDDNHVLYVVNKQTGKARTHFTIHSLTGAITAL